MEAHQSKAWDCLTLIERQSLFLRLSENKSSWEVGEMLKLSHYKYLEVRDRSEYFFKLFSNFFEIHPSIFRPDGPCEQQFKDYIEALIEKRYSRVQAREYTGNSSMVLPKVTNRCIIRNMEYLKLSSISWDRDTHKLIMEFDRWNNFRILPSIIQQPSAFKRRLNKKDKIYIKYLIKKVPELVIDKIKEKYWYKVKPSKPKYWVALFKSNKRFQYILMPIRPLKEVVDEMSRHYLYVFNTRDEADTFGFMVSKYYLKTSGIKLGQKFWPEYRLITSQAINYNEVNNIDFNVKQLNNAFTNKYHKPKKSSRTHIPGVERAKPELFL